MSTRHVTFEQVQEVIRNCPEPWCKLFTTLLETGARYMEIAALMPEQVGIDSIKIEPHFLPNGKWWKPKRPASVRALVVDPHFAEYLREGTTPRKLIFFPEKCAPTQDRTANYFLRKHCKLLGIPVFSTHQLRRVRITQALAAGANPNTVRAAVGHRSLVTTVSYMNDIPIRGVLPAVDAAPVADPAVSQYMAIARPRNWK